MDRAEPSPREFPLVKDQGTINSASVFGEIGWYDQADTTSSKHTGMPTSDGWFFVGCLVVLFLQAT